MNKTRIEGNIDKAKGSVKETVGKVFGSDRLRAEGQADRLKGHIKDTAGKAADAVRHAIDRTLHTIGNTSKH